MKNPIVGREVPSALFVFLTGKDGEYDLVRGSNGSSCLVQAIVKVISKKMLTTMWVYIDYLIRSGYDKPGVSTASNLFEVPIKEVPISGFTDPVQSSPRTFFEENEPGLVVAPLAAINLGAAIEVVIVVRDRETPVYSDDVLRSLRSFTDAEVGETPILLPETVKRMATRIDASLDSGPIEVKGRKMFLSLGFKVEDPAVVAPKPERKPFTVKRKAAPRNPSPESPQFAFPSWPPSASE